MAGYIGSKASVVSSGAERKKTFTITGATTSLTGLNYTVGKVHVFQNGVRLVDGTDYTATNGTSITLTVAAQSGDNVVVISQAAFQVADALLTSGGTLTGDLTVQGAFTSQGIDDNGTSTALTIDTSNNLLVGKTALEYSSNTGHILRNDGLISAVRSGGNVANLNRLSSDGEIIRLSKDGTTVGSIGNDGGNLTINSSSTGILQTVGVSRYNWDDAQFYPEVDNNKNLGHPSYRFKDAYLSGGVYLGGTGSANKLDDYEEGTFTPTVTVGTLGDAAGAYTKIGDTVIVRMYMGAFSNRSSGSILSINNLPFTSANALANGAGGSIFSRYCTKIPNATYVSNNSTNVEMYESATGNYDTVKHADLSSVSAYFFIQIIYKTS